MTTQGAAMAMALAVAATAFAAGDRQAVNVTPTIVLPSMAGPDIFSHFCATCHGRDGRGNGPAAPALKTPPADLTRLAADNHGEFPAARVKDAITRGSADPPSHGSADMPVWGPIFQYLDGSDKLAQTRIANVVAYIDSIQLK